MTLRLRNCIDSSIGLVIVAYRRYPSASSNLLRLPLVIKSSLGRNLYRLFLDDSESFVFWIRGCA